MAWSNPDQGISFRATSGYVTDPSNVTYCTGDTYPTTRLGMTFGWESGGSPSTRDRSTGVDARLAGNNQILNTGTAGVFRIDLDGSAYDIDLALGDASFAQGYQYLQFQDGTTPFATIDDSGGTAGGHFDDATGTDYTSANWPGSNTSISRTFSTSILRLVVGNGGSGGGNSTPAHIFLTDTSGGGGTPRVGSLATLGVGL